MKISYIKRNDIDDDKWDKCIARSVNGIVYAYAWYLDTVAENWDALVGDDYRSLFPLPFKIKYGIRYIYQPFFCQQLGVFSVGHISSELVNSFLQAIPSDFQLISTSLNTFIKGSFPLGKIQPRVTHHLDLIETYPSISQRYSLNTKRNISKAVAYNISVSRGMNANQLVDLKRSNMAVMLRPNQFTMLSNLINTSISKGVGELYGAYNQYNELCAGALFLKANGKAIYLLATTSEEGRRLRAMFALVDYFIYQNSERHLVLDFEGSSIESVARFYQGFGASPCDFYHMVINRLPWYLKLFKKW